MKQGEGEGRIGTSDEQGLPPPSIYLACGTVDHVSDGEDFKSTLVGG
jgi:hypothetical protein